MVCQKGSYPIEDRCLQDDFWTSFQEALGTQLNFSTTYHPETDGKTERTNQILEDMLRMYVMDQHKTLGRVLATGRVCIQQQLSKYH
jgi:hypothetical protein